MDIEKELGKALYELRKEKTRKFDQTVDLIINLKNFDPKKNQVNLIINAPFKVKNKKICAFLETKNKKVETITPEQFKNYSEKKQIKKLIKNFDFFIAQASLMPKIASVFGKVLGPAGKMPSPQLGILEEVNDNAIEELKKKIENSIKIKVKEASVKVSVGKQSMKDSEILENSLAVYSSLLKALPKGIENIKNLQLKFTMTKPIKIKLK